MLISSCRSKASNNESSIICSAFGTTFKIWDLNMVTMCVFISRWFSIATLTIMFGLHALTFCLILQDGQSTNDFVLGSILALHFEQFKYRLIESILKNFTFFNYNFIWWNVTTIYINRDWVSQRYLTPLFWCIYIDSS